MATFTRYRNDAQGQSGGSPDSIDTTLRPVNLLPTVPTPLVSAATKYTHPVPNKLISTQRSPASTPSTIHTTS